MLYSSPGPNLGYSNSSIKEVSTLFLFLLNGLVKALKSALDKDNPLTL